LARANSGLRRVGTARRLLFFLATDMAVSFWQKF
jgi:hypothetical protein